MPDRAGEIKADCEIGEDGYHVPILVSFRYGDEVICDLCATPLGMTTEEYLR